MEKNSEGRIEFEVLIHDAGPDRKARLKSMFNFLQDTVDIHARMHGTSINDIEKLNLSWVYSRFYAEIKRYPGLHEKITCRTWRSKLDRYLAYREFTINDSSGIPILAATSSLALINKETRKPTELKIPSSSLFETIPEKAVEFRFDRLPQPDSYDYSHKSVTRLEDIDVNGHMNNASYAQHFFESVYGRMDEKELTFIDIAFRGEVSWRDELTCLASPAGNGIYFHKMVNETRGNTSALAATGWRQD